MAVKEAGVTESSPHAPARERSVLERTRGSSGDFLRRVYKKAEQDQIFFMGGAIAFNVLVAIVPLALAAVGVAGFFLQAQEVVSPADPVVQYLLQVLPPVSPAFAAYMRATLNDIVSQSTGLFTIGTIVFAWLATRLVGTLRTALREIFDIQQDRGIIAGKFFDLQMVFVAGTLLAINIAITFGLNRVTEAGIGFLRIADQQGSLLQDLIGQALAFLTIWFMFVLIYRYLPARRIHWRTGIISATFTALLFELMKSAFALYFRNANYASTYGALGFIAIVVIYVYYMALAFILGGEVGQVASLQRIRRRQKERLG
ncbi:MAG: YihY/virulence factor BrkB family protein [Longimicrobiales bacterium]